MIARLPELTAAAADAIKKIEQDLLWRGPSGKPLGMVVLHRDKAEALLMWIEAVIRQQESA
jgi:hypothetical protein